MLKNVLRKFAHFRNHVVSNFYSIAIDKIAAAAFKCRWSRFEKTTSLSQVTWFERASEQRATLLSMQMRERTIPSRLFNQHECANTYAHNSPVIKSLKNDINPTWALHGGFPDLQWIEKRGASHSITSEAFAKRFPLIFSYPSRNFVPRRGRRDESSARIILCK